MRAFQVFVGKFEIVATTGQAHGSMPASKSEAAGFDVIDRRVTGNTQYVCRDQLFEDAFEICVRRAMVHPLH
ncbi:hypothetical protein [Paraburkholderia aromaticivorans]|uniref:hypothetical protein n=1 Tax=Paraburkholderia aromaticivorans TaxID=2026199 RepID=UPI0014562139|nr:hypothetical protein [Paraburkholderia aromaticivorans]